MITRRIIACLDVKDGRVVKGVNFTNIQDVGSIEDLSKYYADQGIDELVFYDITASCEKRTAEKKWISRVSQNINIPFCVAGGIRSIDEARVVLENGADKVSINSPAIENKYLIRDLAREFGSQAVVVGVDSVETMDGDRIMLYSGSESKREITSIPTLKWVSTVQDLGAGEVVINSVGSDGGRYGFDVRLLKEIRSISKIPLIASGGAGCAQHFYDAFNLSNVDGCLAASSFHKRTILVPELKKYLVSKGIEVRT